MKQIHIVGLVIVGLILYAAYWAYKKYV